MKKLTLYRYYLEMLAVPVFAFLVIHLSGHALMLLADPEHDHSAHQAEETYEDHDEEKNHTDDDDDHEAEEHHDEDHEDEHEDEDHEEAHKGETHENEDHEAQGAHVEHDDHAGHGHGEGLNIEYLLSTEVLGGILGLILFVWIWHLSFMKPLVPCSHDHCHHKTMWPHIAATVAFVFHWFPEAQIRYEMLKDFSSVNWLDMAAVVGFGAHFLVDAIILILLASFWPQLWQKVSVALVLTVLWMASFWVGHNGGIHLEGVAEPIILLLSAFLLAMFVHKPHKPEPECKSCSH